MSLKSWKEEFYPIRASSAEAIDTEEAALRHTELKWTGLLKENLEKHNLKWDYEAEVFANISDEDEYYEDDDYDVDCFTVGDINCALCQRHPGIFQCSACSLCQEAKNCCSGGKGSELNEFMEYGNASPMLKLIRKTLKNRIEVEKKEQCDVPE